MTLAIRDSSAIQLMAADIAAVRVGCWIEERLSSNSRQNQKRRADSETAWYTGKLYGRPRKVVAIIHRSVTRRRHAYVAIRVAFGDGTAAWTLIQGSPRFRIAEKPAVYDLAACSLAAESNCEVFDM